MKKYRILIDIAIRGGAKAKDDLDKMKGPADRAAKSLGGLKVAAGAVAGALAAMGLGAAVQQIRQFVTDSVSAYKEQAGAEGQLAAAIRSTGGAAGFTKEQLVAQAKALQDQSTASDEAIIRAQSLLLTFTKISGETFPAATQAVVDLAARMQGDFKGAALQVGKALNDPVAGVAALREVGVSFGPVQQDLIKGFVEAGEMAKAQAVILKELTVEYGGSALAAREAGGQTQALANVWRDFLATVGEVSVIFGPVIEFMIAQVKRLTAFVEANLPEIQRFFLEFFDTLQKLGRIAFQAVIDDLFQLIGLLLKANDALNLPGSDIVRDKLLQVANAAGAAGKTVREMGEDLDQAFDDARLKNAIAFAERALGLGPSAKNAAAGVSSLADEMERVANAKAAKELERLKAASEGIAARFKSERDKIQEDLDTVARAFNLGLLSKEDYEPAYRALQQRLKELAEETSREFAAKTSEALEHSYREALEGFGPKTRKFIQESVQEIDTDEFGQGMADSTERGLRQINWRGLAEDLGAIFADILTSRLREAIGQTRLSEQSERSGLTLTRDSEAQGREYGEAIGRAIGTALGGGSPIVSQIFGFFGEALGGAIARITASSPFFSFDVVLKNGQLAMQNLDTNKRDVEEIREFGQALVSAVQELFAGLGATFEGLDNFQITEAKTQRRKGAKPKLQVRINEKVVAEFETIEELFAGAFLELVKRIDFSGVPAKIRDAIRKAAANPRGARGEEQLLNFQKELNLIQQLGGGARIFGDVAAGVRKLATDVKDLVRAQREYGFSIEDVKRALRDSDSVLEDILSPIASFLPEFQRQQQDKVFDKVIDDLTEYKNALQLEIAELERAIEAELARQFVMDQSTDAAGRLLQTEEDFNRTREEAIARLRAEMGLLQEALDSAPTIDEINEGRRRSKRGGGNRKQERENLLQTLDDIAARSLPEVGQALRDSELELASIREELIRLNVPAEKYQEILARERERIEEELRSGVLERAFDFLNADGPLLRNIRETEKGTTSLIQELAELANAGLITAQEFSDLSEQLIARARELQNAAITNEAQSLQLTLLELLGKDEEAAKLRFRLQLAELKLRRDELLIAAKSSAASLRGSSGMLVAAQGVADIFLELQRQLLEAQAAATGRGRVNIGGGGGGLTRRNRNPFAEIIAEINALIAELEARGPTLPDDLGDIADSLGDIGAAGPSAAEQLADFLKELEQIGRDAGPDNAATRLAQLNARVADLVARMLELGGPMSAVEDAARRLGDAFLRELLDPLLERRSAVAGLGSDRRTSFNAAQASFRNLARLALGGDVNAVESLPEAIDRLRDAARGLDPNVGGAALVDRQIDRLIAQLASSGIVGDLGAFQFEAGTGFAGQLETLTDATTSVGNAQLTELQGLRTDVQALTAVLEAQALEAEIA